MILVCYNLSMAKKARVVKSKSKTRSALRSRPNQSPKNVLLIGLFLLLAVGLTAFLSFKRQAAPLEVAQISTSPSSNYRVGVNYHATGLDFAKDSFILNYHRPQVRNLVRSQLQDMADKGASFVSTRLWVVDQPSKRYPAHAWRLGFPFSSQELDNIKQYARDVGSIKRPDGQPLDLYLTLLWLGCAKYNQEVNPCGISWQNLVSNAKQTITQLFQAIGNETRPDGKKLVATVYMDGEIDVVNKKNTDKWLTEVYPHFISTAHQYQINPSIYFLPDTLSPNLNAVSNTRVHRTIEFMAQNNLYIPSRIDLSLYATKIDGSYQGVVDKIIADLKSSYPNHSFAAAETGYPKDLANRQLYGQAFVNSYQKTGQPVEVAFWTTPNSPDHEAYASYPFDIQSYLLPQQSHFEDVPPSHPFYKPIEAVRLAQISSGCSSTPNRFCPDAPLNRAQASIMLLRSRYGSSFNPSTPRSQRFTDVPSSNPHYAWIDKLAADGITSGCRTNEFCPNDSVTRAQFAVLLLRAKNGSSYRPPAVSSSSFTDSSSHSLRNWIEALNSTGATTGCGGNNFCPDRQITRAEAVAMIASLFSL